MWYVTLCIHRPVLLLKGLQQDGYCSGWSWSYDYLALSAVLWLLFELVIHPMWQKCYQNTWSSFNTMLHHFTHTAKEFRVERPSSNQKVLCSIPGSFRECFKVSLRKTLNPYLLLCCVVSVCERVNDKFTVKRCAWSIDYLNTVHLPTHAVVHYMLYSNISSPLLGPWEMNSELH